MPSSHRRNRTPEPELARPHALALAEDPADTGEREQPDTPSLFRARLAAGDYDALIGQGLRRTLQHAAADATLEAEIGALRVALAKLLNEEDDPSRLAAGVSRVAGVAVQAARLRNSASADGESLRSAMLRALDEVEKEHARCFGQGKDEEKDTSEEMQSDDVDGRNGDVLPGAHGHAGFGIRQGAGQPGAGVGLRNRDAPDGAEPERRPARDQSPPQRAPLHGDRRRDSGGHHESHGVMGS
jgi:hypothetical protein